MEHVPLWALHSPRDHGGTELRYYAPQYRTDCEWYDNALFYGEPGQGGRNECYTRNQTWPLGQFQPYKRNTP
jgi:hypothetical protein